MTIKIYNHQFTYVKKLPNSLKMQESNNQLQIVPVIASPCLVHKVPNYVISCYESYENPRRHAPASQWAHLFILIHYIYRPRISFTWFSILPIFSKQGIIKRLLLKEIILDAGDGISAFLYNITEGVKVINVRPIKSSATALRCVQEYTCINVSAGLTIVHHLCR